MLRNLKEFVEKFFRMEFELIIYVINLFLWRYFVFFELKNFGDK